jgi:acyl-CoA hydrolase
MKVTCEYGEEEVDNEPSPKSEAMSSTKVYTPSHAMPVYHGVLSPDVHWLRQTEPLVHHPFHLDQERVTADEAVDKVKSGDRIFIGGNCGEPDLLMQALMRRGDTLRNVEVIHVLTLGPVPYVEPVYATAFRANVFFIGQNMRSAVNHGRADYTPISLSEIPRLFREGDLKIDVALISVSPPDAQGYCSFGVEVGLTKPAAENAQVVIAEINPHMPRVWGNSFIHVSQIDYFVPVDYPLPEVLPVVPSPVHQRIGEYVADMIEDEATLQVGNGAVPSAVLNALGDKRDLGVHTEMFCDGIIDLVERGVITGRCKSLLPGKIVASFVRGTQRLYDFVRDNPLVEMHPIDFTNDSYVIGQNDKMVAINSALQIDLTGQVSADSIGCHLHSGVGGQADFIRGAAKSKGGKPIIALPSTALGGEVSRIVAMLDPGGGVTVTRNDVHYVVTEYGVAQLFGKSVRRRAEELINIAHPDFRADLYAAARERNLF